MFEQAFRLIDSYAHLATLFNPSFSLADCLAKKDMAVALRKNILAQYHAGKFDKQAKPEHIQSLLNEFPKTQPYAKKPSIPLGAKAFEALELTVLTPEYQEKIYTQLSACVDSLEIRTYMLETLNLSLEDLPEKVVLEAVEMNNTGLLNAYLGIRSLSNKMTRTAIKCRHWSLLTPGFHEKKLKKLAHNICDEIVKGKQDSFVDAIVNHSTLHFLKEGLTNVFCDADKRNKDTELAYILENKMPSPSLNLTVMRSYHPGDSLLKMGLFSPSKGSTRSTLPSTSLEYEFKGV